MGEKGSKKGKVKTSKPASKIQSQTKVPTELFSNIKEFSFTSFSPDILVQRPLTSWTPLGNAQSKYNFAPCFLDSWGQIPPK